MHHRRLLPLLLFLVINGCGGARSSEAPAPMSAAPPEPEPTTLEEAQAQLERAKVQLGATNAPSADAAGASAPRAPAAPPQQPQAERAPAPAPPPAPASKSMESKSAVQQYRAEEAVSDPCADSCRALASMRRAVAAICRIAGNADARCTDAKATLASSEQRVSTCRCP
ncbi:hypothetical protein LZC95_53000 [Pendulispora brunnea]|uniref:Uncharacterized protein n=1 Tax=Pendulispora brunnea TaxID=2905690 RepID=A0ABZ2K923_9BACT